MSKAAFYTLGCRVNQYESDAMAELFANKGYEIVDFDSPADIYIVNTCDVTNESSRKSRQSIRKAVKNNPDAVVAVVGCYAQLQAEEISKIPGVDVVVGTKHRHRIVDFVESVSKDGGQIIAVEDIMQERAFEDIAFKGHRQRTRAFLKIQEGCNMFCSYCIIPYARGPIRSRTMESIQREAKNLAEDGFKEIVLTGIHLGLYGHDIKDTKLHLSDVAAMLAEINGLNRIRLSSIEALELTDDFLEILSKIDKFCHHFHIPLQSGSNSVLRRMHRRYTKEQFQERVNAIRRGFADVSITTDVITGFPGETPEEFDETLDFIKETGFSKLHVFPFSPKEGTPAAKMDNPVPKSVKTERSHILLELSQDLEERYRENFLGRTMDVLFEDEFKKGLCEGLTKNYIKVVVPSLEELNNKVLPVSLLENHKHHILGNILPQFGPELI